MVAHSLVIFSLVAIGFAVEDEDTSNSTKVVHYRYHRWSEWVEIGDCRASICGTCNGDNTYGRRMRTCFQCEEPMKPSDHFNPLYCNRTKTDNCISAGVGMGTQVRGCGNSACPKPCKPCATQLGATKCERHTVGNETFVCRWNKIKVTCVAITLLQKDFEKKHTTMEVLEDEYQLPPPDVPLTDIENAKCAMEANLEARFHGING